MHVHDIIIIIDYDDPMLPTVNQDPTFESSANQGHEPLGVGMLYADLMLFEIHPLDSYKLKVPLLWN